MPSQSQQLPKSAKLETLPEELRTLADQLIAKKFNLPVEGEVEQPKKEVPQPKPIDEYPELLNYRRISYELRPKGWLDERHAYYDRDMLRDIPRTIDIAVSDTDDPMYIADKLRGQIEHIERRYNVRLEVRRLN